jgi:hypothetical protein
LVSAQNKGRLGQCLGEDISWVGLARDEMVGDLTLHSMVPHGAQVYVQVSGVAGISLRVYSIMGPFVVSSDRKLHIGHTQMVKNLLNMQDILSAVTHAPEFRLSGGCAPKFDGV